MLARAHQHHAEPAERAALICNIVFVARGVAVADARQRSRARNREPDQVVGVGNHAPLRVDDFHANGSDLLAVGGRMLNLGGQPQRGGRARGLHRISRRFASARSSHGGERPGSVHHFPIKKVLPRHLLQPEALALKQ